MSRLQADSNTYIRKLPFSVIQKIVSLLEPDQLWKKLVVNIPKKLDSPEFTERYSDIQVKMIEEKGRKPGSSSTRCVME